VYLSLLHLPICEQTFFAAVIYMANVMVLMDVKPLQFLFSAMMKACTAIANVIFKVCDVNFTMDYQ